MQMFLCPFQLLSERWLCAPSASSPATDGRCINYVPQQNDCSRTHFLCEMQETTERCREFLCTEETMKIGGDENLSIALDRQMSDLGDAFVIRQGRLSRSNWWQIVAVDLSGFSRILRFSF
jgi:hypothetical protein